MKVFVSDKPVELPDGSRAIELAEKLNLRAPNESLCASINGTLYDLSHSLKEGDKVELISFDEKRGKELFWHTSAHVLAQAILRIWPEAKPTIGPAIESGFYYDFANLTISEHDLEKIEKEVEAIIRENYRPERHLFKSKKEALARFKDNPYKLELIEGFEEGPITGYSQGEFFDLCRGPHLPSLGKIKAFKILKTSGAYWKGDPKRETLTRIYGISFPDRKLLKEYLTFLEEAKKRDHKILGPKLDIFSIKEEAPGMPFIHPKGMIDLGNIDNFLEKNSPARGIPRNKNPSTSQSTALGVIGPLASTTKKTCTPSKSKIATLRSNR